MDTGDPSPLARPWPQQSGTANRAVKMPTPSSAHSDATAVGTEPLNTPTQQPHHEVEYGNDSEQTFTSNLPTTAYEMTLAVRGRPLTAETQSQSTQADGGILESDIYLSACKLLAANTKSEKGSRPNESIAADAAATHSHFSEPLDRLMSDISAGGHDNLLPDVMLPGLAHLVSLLEMTCSAPSNATNSTTAYTAASLGPTPFTFHSLPPNSSASSMLVSTTTSNPTSASHEATSPVWDPATMTLAFRSHPVKSSTSSPPISISTAQPFRLFSLPHDVKVRALSFVPEANIALNCRLVCREFRDLVVGNEVQVVQLIAEREHFRLQSQINMRRQMAPRNLTDFVFDASRWVRLRGFFPSNPRVTIDSFTDWRLSPDGNRDLLMQGREVMPCDLAIWGSLTTNLSRLQLDLHRDVDALGMKLMDTLQDYAIPSGAFCTTATLLEYQRLCFMIWDCPVSEPFFSGEEHGHANGERGTFPELRLSAASYRHHARGRRSLKPQFPLQDVQELGLPELKDKKFFYYFGEDVGHDVFEKLAPLTPLKRASLLKMVELL